jgi:hypothetical protein
MCHTNPVLHAKLVRHSKLVRPGGGISDAIRAIEVELDLAEPNILWLRYSIIGDMRRLRIPRLSSPTRRNGLWQHTCFEVFVKGSGAAYFELNISPSRQWAAFCFDAYRQGMAQLQLSPAPRIHVESSLGGFALVAVVDLKGLPKLDAAGGRGSDLPRLSKIVTVACRTGHPPIRPAKRIFTIPMGLYSHSRIIALALTQISAGYQGD